MITTNTAVNANNDRSPNLILPIEITTVRSGDSRSEGGAAF